MPWLTRRWSPGLLRTHPAFRQLWWARAVSLLGDRCSLLAVPILALDRLHATAGQAALLFAVQSLPTAIVALPAAARLVGRSERAAMIGCDVVRGCLLAACALTPGLTLAALLAAVTVIGVANTVFDVAAQAYVPRIVDRADYGEANSRLAQASGATWVAGPLLVGMLIGAVGPSAAILADAASFAVSWILLAQISDRMSPPGAAGTPVAGTAADDSLASDDPVDAGWWRKLADGCRAAIAHRGLRAIIGAATLFNLGGAMISALWFPYLLRLLRISPALIGALATAGGISTLGTVLMIRHVMRSASPRVLLPASLVTGVGTIWLIPLAADGHAILLLIAYQLAFNAAAAAFGVVGITVRQLLTPQRYQGRVFALALALSGLSLPVGGALASALARSTSLVTAMVMGAAVTSLSLGTVPALAAAGADSTTPPASRAPRGRARHG